MRSVRITLALSIMFVLSCGGSAQHEGAAGSGGSSRSPAHAQAGPTSTSSPLFRSKTCGTQYPAHACDGDPHGKWMLSSICVNLYENCKGASVKATGTASAMIDFQDG